MMIMIEYSEFTVIFTIVGMTEHLFLICHSGKHVFMVL